MTVWRCNIQSYVAFKLSILQHKQENPAQSLCFLSAKHFHLHTSSSLGALNFASLPHERNVQILLPQPQFSKQDCRRKFHVLRIMFGHLNQTLGVGGMSLRLFQTQPCEICLRQTRSLKGGWSATEIPDPTNKVAIVTGSASRLGFVAIK